MRRAGLIVLALGLAAAAWLWLGGGSDRVAAYATQTQRDVQNAMAAALRALRQGEPGALTTLWGLCFAYGFVHAAGPGHGKLVIGGYGLAARVTAFRLSGLALASSLAQALTAVVFVYAGVLALGWTRDQVSGTADRVMAPLSYALIVGVGVWLLLRGLRHLRANRRTVSATDHGHHHDHDHHHHDHDADGVCSTCGHAHAPTPEQAANVRSLRDALAIVAAIAIRPCTGAIFLLILTWRFGIDWVGIVGAFVMGLGTATLTLTVALASVTFRESALAQAASAPATARTLALIEVLVGALVAAVALQLLLRSL